jgi:predicted helicase
MRWNLLKSFDKIYIIDLHGNASKKEKDLDGGADENVFDIQQGVSINIFIKNKGAKKSIQHFDLFGKREFKYDFLNSNDLNSISWNQIKIDNDNCFFTSKDLTTDKGYLKYISISDLMPLNNSGIQTKCDNISINESIEELKKVVSLFQNESVEKLKTIFNREESSGWNFQNAKDDLIKNPSVVFAKYNYRPFDFRNIVYTGTSSGFLGRSRSIVMKHFINQPNIGICLMRQFFQDAPYSHIYATNSLIDERTMYSNRGGTYLFPLYLYPENNGQQTIGQSTERQPNLNTEIVKQIADKLGLTFTNEKETTKDTFAPIDILDYIYAVLHSPTYREKYKEFLKIDFPRVPYPKDKETFWQLVTLGSQIRQIHLLESQTVEKYITQYPIDGDNAVTKPKYQDGKVYINDTQYFNNVPQTAWEFYIGGYQPAQKWLKDRKDRKLEFDDILHYQKIIVALTETDRLMKEINKIDIE